MENVDEVIQQLRQTHRDLEGVDAATAESGQLLLLYNDTIDTCCHTLKTHTGNRHDEQVLNYCQAKLEHARRMVHNFNFEEACAMTKGVLGYIIKVYTEKRPREKQ